MASSYTIDTGNSFNNNCVICCPMDDGVGAVLEMLEKASRIDDLDLIKYLSKRIADIWRDGPKLVSQSPNRIITTTERRADRG